MISDFGTFVEWERASRDTIDFKKIYVDMTAGAIDDHRRNTNAAQGDIIAGLILSQIVYWHLPDKNGKTRLRVNKNGYYWIAKRKSEWWDEIRVTEKQAARALSILRKLDLIVVENYRFNGFRTNHIRINRDVFLQRFAKIAGQDEKGRPSQDEKGRPSQDEKGRPITESTSQRSHSKTTSEINNNNAAVADFLQRIGLSNNKRVKATLKLPHVTDDYLNRYAIAFESGYYRDKKNPAGFILTEIENGNPPPALAADEPAAGFSTEIPDATPPPPPEPGDLVKEQLRQMVSSATYSTSIEPLTFVLNGNCLISGPDIPLDWAKKRLKITIQRAANYVANREVKLVWGIDEPQI